MDCFIKKIFNGVCDKFVHLQFQKFSRGTYQNRALLRATSSTKGYSLWTGPEYANELVRAVAERLGDNRSQISGVIVSTNDLKNVVPSVGLKQFMGVKQYVIESLMSGNEIISLLDNIPEAFFALSFGVGDALLKIKPKAPKSTKPKTSEEPPKADFCSLKTSSKDLIERFVWETGWKSFEARHTFIIKDIELANGLSEPNEIRKQAKRIGTVVRLATIDSKENRNEKAFVV